MKQRLASLFLLLVLCGGAFAGVPLQFGEVNCSMNNSMDMECCKAMLLLQSQAKFSQEEELLCALNCAQNGTTLPPSAIRITQPTAVRVAPQPVVATLPSGAVALRLHKFKGLHDPPGSPPRYLRNLTLLI